MATDAELRVQMRMQGDKLRQDCDRAAKTIQESLRKTFGGGNKSGLATDPASTIAAILGTPEQQKKAGAYSAKAFFDGWTKHAKSSGGFGIGKFLLGSATAAFNPWIGARLMSDSFKGGRGGKSGGVAGGIFGAGGAMGFAEFYLAINLFKKAAETFKQSVTNAGQLYAKSLTTGGLSLGFVSQRSMLAQTMGVSEHDVMQFGKQMEYLNPKLEWASNKIAKTAPALTQVGWAFSVLQNNTKALFADIAYKGAPAMQSFAEQLSTIIKQMDDFVARHPKATRAIAELPNAMLFALGLGPDGKTVANNEMSAKKIGNPLAYMKQLPASSLEHAGLVIGGGGNSPAQQTARNTGNMVKQLQTIAQKLGATTSGFGLSPSGVSKLHRHE